ncbi:MAG: hypothetical protein DRJ03_04410 [Chloroflexi bacterium]|nr:MAG: hypothetical protein B6I35_00815 [Anaerolineaceae bacterium 4572_32.2]RLC81708.1 MAG: hypothetical protein DRI81_01770 [Chloroflexota bacterium]RLC87924.1 MAG: hypothetical protein DRJ03_04410 [Chloroflexota bacterium]HEY74156.1 hypothetical protein [Thermoflexia bacterium]
MKQIYPDISDILAAKSKQRRTLVALSWEDKVAIVERMRALLPKGQWKNRPAVQPDPPLDASANTL